MNKALFFIFVLSFVVLKPNEVKARSTISMIDSIYEQSEDYNKHNTLVRSIIDIPYYFNVPYVSFSAIPEEISLSHDSDKSNPVVLFNYRETSTNLKEDRKLENSLGLRLMLVNGQDNRITTSNALAESGLIKTGDILLSFRPEWYGSLRYSHIQLGISHAGIAYIKKGSDGKDYLYNLDMPMNESLVGADRRSRLTSEHYQKAQYVHVLRLKGISDAQRENIAKWIELLVSRNPYQKNLFFNTDYSQPNYQPGQETKFIGDLARIALGLPVSTALKMYCSEFVWTMLALSPCDPDQIKNELKTKASPSCVAQPFAPMPVFGSLALSQDTTQSGLTVGMSDGPVLLADIMGATGETRNDLIRRAVFNSADGNPENISSGHKAVEQSILSKNPQFFDIIHNYYDMTALPNASSHPQVLGIQQAVNASQKLNYSPTSFQVHAILPNSVPEKKMEYVGTIVYVIPKPLISQKLTEAKEKNRIGDIQNPNDPYSEVLRRAKNLLGPK